MSARDDYPFPAAVADGRINGGVYGQGETAAALDEIDRLRCNAAQWEAIRQTVNCPTCEGERWDWKRSHDEDLRLDDPVDAYPCDDCPDGKIGMARLLAVGAAVFDAERGTETDLGRDELWSLYGRWELLDELRETRP